MTGRKGFIVRCDWPSCPRQWDGATEASTLATLRNWGWTRIGLGDYCSDHSAVPVAAPVGDGEPEP